MLFRQVGFITGMCKQTAALFDSDKKESRPTVA